MPLYSPRPNCWSKWEWSAGFGSDSSSSLLAADRAHHINAITMKNNVVSNNRRHCDKQIFCRIPLEATSGIHCDDDPRLMPQTESDIPSQRLPAIVTDQMRIHKNQFTTPTLRTPVTKLSMSPWRVNSFKRFATHRHTHTSQQYVTVSRAV